MPPWILFAVGLGLETVEHAWGCLPKPVELPCPTRLPHKRFATHAERHLMRCGDQRDGGGKVRCPYPDGVLLVCCATVSATGEVTAGPARSPEPALPEAADAGASVQSPAATASQRLLAPPKPRPPAWPPAPTPPLPAPALFAPAASHRRLAKPPSLPPSAPPGFAPGRNFNATTAALPPPLVTPPGPPYWAPSPIVAPIPEGAYYASAALESVANTVAIQVRTKI